MKKKQSKSVSLLVILVLIVLAVIYFGGDDEESRYAVHDESAELLENRIWVDIWPEKATDKFHLYQFIPELNHSGVYQDRTLFAGDFELFLYEVGEQDGRAQVTITWPHSNQRVRLPFRITRVDGPKPFDLKLVLEGNDRGPVVLYGMSGKEQAVPWLLSAP